MSVDHLFVDWTGIGQGGTRIEVQSWQNLDARLSMKGSVERRGSRFNPALRENAAHENRKAVPLGTAFLICISV